MEASFSEIQLDALRELANIGSGTAATALSRLVGREVDISVPVALALPVAEAVDAVGDAEEIVTGIALPVVGDLEAMVLLLIRPECARSICALLGVEAHTEIGQSALGEVGNILGSSYIGALGAMTGMRLEPRPPQTVTDMLGAIVATVLAERAGSSDLALLLDSELDVEREACSFSFILVPDASRVVKLLACLGLAE